MLPAGSIRRNFVEFLFVLLSKRSTKIDKIISHFENLAHILVAVYIRDAVVIPL